MGLGQVEDRHPRGDTKRIQRVPANILAGLFGRKERDFFQIEDDAERDAPAVSLNDDS